jgi:hypothetical protein
MSLSALRYNIKLAPCHGETINTPPASVQTWFWDVLPPILKEFSQENIFNCDELGLLYRSFFPKRTLCLSSEKPSSVKQSKERITVLLCASCIGEKRNLLIIGHSRRPRGYETHISKLPLTYVSNKNAWMTTNIFLDFLSSLSLFAKTQKRKLCLLCDRCSAHSVSDFSSEWVKLVFFPPNCTTVLQPLDGGVIHAFKANYKRQLLKEFLSHAELNAGPFKWTISDAADLLSRCWTAIKKDTILNCFHHVGITNGEITNSNIRKLLKLPPLTFPQLPLRSSCSPHLQIFEENDELLFDKSKEYLGGDAPTNFHEFVTSDDELEARGCLSEEEIIQFAQGERTQSKEILQTLAPPQSHMRKASLLHALSLLKTEIKKADATPTLKQLVLELQTEIVTLSAKGMLTPSITEYFLPRDSAVLKSADGDKEETTRQRMVLICEEDESEEVGEKENESERDVGRRSEVEKKYLGGKEEEEDEEEPSGEEEVALKSVKDRSIM